MSSIPIILPDEMPRCECCGEFLTVAGLCGQCKLYFPERAIEIAESRMLSPEDLRDDESITPGY